MLNYKVNNIVVHYSLVKDKNKDKKSGNRRI